jgi:hypothetical protein
MKLLNLDGSEFGDAPAWLANEAPAVIGRSFTVSMNGDQPAGRGSGSYREVVFIRLNQGLRFYADRDLKAWLAATKGSTASQ